MDIRTNKKKVRLPTHEVLKISEELEEIKQYTPIEFSRKPRRLTEVAFWKATEFRMFLLYIGPIVLEKHLPTNLFSHFKKLHVAIRLLIMAGPDDIDLAESLLKGFVKSFGFLHGKELISHNIHGLIHVSDDVRRLGSLDNYSAFPFENHLQKMKNLIRKGNQTLEQLSKRYSEQFAFLTQLKNENCKNEIILKGLHVDGPTVASYDGLQYKKAILGKFTVGKKIPDNCSDLKSNGDIVFIENIIKSEQQIYVVGRKFKRISNSYDKPCVSSKISSFEVQELSSLKIWLISELKTKYFIIPRKNSYLVTAMIHTDL